MWAGIAVVAVLEPTFQLMFARDLFSWAAAYTWLHVFAIALLQLYVSGATTSCRCTGFGSPTTPTGMSRGGRFHSMCSSR